MFQFLPFVFRWIRLPIGLVLIFSISLAYADEDPTAPLRLRTSKTSSATDKTDRCIRADVFQKRLTQIIYRQAELRSRLNNAYFTASSHAPRELLAALKKTLTKKHQILWNVRVCEVSKDFSRMRMRERNKLQNDIAQIHSEAALQRLRRKKLIR